MKQSGLEVLTDTAAARLQKLKINFEIPGFPKVSDVGLQISILIWLVLLLLLLNYFYTSRVKFFQYTGRAFRLRSEELFFTVSEFHDFDITIPFWLMPLPRRDFSVTKADISDFERLFRIRSVNNKTNLIVVALAILTLLFFWSSWEAFSLYYSELQYIYMKRNSINLSASSNDYGTTEIVKIYFYIATCFTIVFSWIFILYRWSYGKLNNLNYPLEPIAPENPRRQFIRTGAILLAALPLHFAFKNAPLIQQFFQRKNKRAYKKKGYNAQYKSSLPNGFYFKDLKKGKHLYYVSSRQSLSGIKNIPAKHIALLEKKLQPAEMKTLFSATAKYDAQITEWMAEDFAIVSWNKGQWESALEILFKVLESPKTFIQRKGSPRTLQLANGLITRMNARYKHEAGTEYFNDRWKGILSMNEHWSGRISSFNKDRNKRYARWRKITNEKEGISWNNYNII